MKKFLILFIGVIAVFLFILIFQILSEKDTGRLAKDKNPIFPQSDIFSTTTNMAENDDTIDTQIDDASNRKSSNKDELIIVTAPVFDQEISSPLEVKGQARGNWFFEASFPVELQDLIGNILVQGIAQADGNWMTSEFVPFSAKLQFNLSTSTDGFLILKKDNPSGMPELDDNLKIPVKILAEENISTFQIFFGNSLFDPDILDCTKNFPIERILLKTDEISRAAIEQLLLGLTEKEKNEGYFTNLNDGIKINSFNVVDGIAKIDFSRELDENMAGSCRVTAARAQIIDTLKQFSDISDVIISVNGRTEDVLQP